MEINELKKELKRMETEYLSSVKRIKIDYAKANNPVNIGDIVRDHNGSIRVERISYYEDYETPSCIYRGPLIKANGEPYKNGKEGAVYQGKLIAHNGKPISVNDDDDINRDSEHRPN